MNRKDKQEAFRQFIESNLTWATWAQLLFLYKGFETNSDYINFELEDIISNNIQTLTHRFRAVHALIRLMVNIETLLAMLFIFSKKKLKSFGQLMLRYDKNQIDRVIDAISDGGSIKYEMFGFPKTKHLDLSKKDRHFLHGLFQDIAKEYIKSLNELVRFYQGHRSAYGKLKHGLMFILGWLRKNQEITKTIFAFDRWEENEFYRQANYYRPLKNPSPPGLEWFNLVTLIPQEENTLKRYGDLNHLVLKTAHGIIQNYLDLGSNCGMDYLPGGIEEVLRSKNELDRLRKYEEIKNKIEPKMNPISSRLNLEFTFREKALRKIAEHWSTDHVSIHWYPAKQDNHVS